jgi:hypothetical protein
VLASAFALAIVWRAAGVASSAESLTPPPEPQTIGTWVSIGPAPIVYADDPWEPEFVNSGPGTYTMAVTATNPCGSSAPTPPLTVAVP